MNIWLRVLNVRRSEWKLVRALYVFEFLQGAGMAFFFTASLALFLTRFSIEELPKVFIYSAILLWVTGYVYTKLEARYNIITLARRITYFMAASFLTFRLLLPATPPEFLFLMFSWFNVLYLLNNLLFWGIASQLFDVRQSKRLFGLISAGDIPAKFIGYSLALLLVSFIGTENLLWIGLGCIVASFPFIKAIENLGQLQTKHVHLQNHHNSKAETKSTFSILPIIRNFFSNVLIRRIAILTLITSSAFIIVNFSFYAKVKQAVHSDVDLAQFIAFFLASVRIFALIVKMIFTGRLINRLGITRSLLITPVLMMSLIAAIFVSDKVIGSAVISLYMFGAMAIVVDILRTSIDGPVLLTLMQPLNTHERLRAHNITKGIMDPFASFLTGVALLALINFRQEMRLAELNYILLGLGLCWIIGIYRIHQQYLKALLKTIGNRFFNNPEFSVNDSSTFHWLKDKLTSGSETEALNILKMMSAQPELFKNDLVFSALDHPSTVVKIEAIRLADKGTIYESREKLKKIRDSSPDAALVAEIIKALCTTGLVGEEILPFVYSENDLIQKAAIIGVLKNGSDTVRQQVRAYLSGMVYSGDRLARKKAAVMLQELGDKSFRDEVLHLTDDPDQEIKMEAFIAAGKMKDPYLLDLAINQINQYEHAVIETLYVANEVSLPHIESFILNRKTNPRQTERLIRLVGRIGGAKSNEVLLNLMDELPEYLHSIAKTFYYSNHSVSVHDRPFFETKVRECLRRSATIIYMQQILMQHQQKYNLLLNSLQIELVHLRDSLLYFFALLYDRNKIKDVRAAFESSKKEAIANALEIIEMTTRKDFATQFNLIFEPADIDYKMYSIKKFYSANFFANVEHILLEILATGDGNYNFWTKACGIYTSKRNNHILKMDVITKYVDAERALLRETAKYAL